jgi:hypothetical protein
MRFHFPPETYGQLALRSSAAVLGLQLAAGVIGESPLSPSRSPPHSLTPHLSLDPDYTGNVKAIIWNLNRDTDLVLKKDASYVQLLVPYHFDGFVLIDSVVAPEEEEEKPPSPRSMDQWEEEEEGIDEELETVLVTRGEGGFGSTGATSETPSSPPPLED